MASHNIPNRPAGGDTRSIADILANFDYITSLTEGLAEGSGFDAGAILSNIDFFFNAYTTTNTGNLPEGTYVVLGIGQIYNGSGTGSMYYELLHTGGGSAVWTPSSATFPRVVGSSIQGESVPFAVGGILQVNSGNVAAYIQGGPGQINAGMLVFGIQDYIQS